MAEWFKETYRLDNLALSSGYVVRDKGRPVGVALNLERDDKFGSGGQLVLTKKEIAIAYAVLQEYAEDSKNGNK